MGIITSLFFHPEDFKLSPHMASCDIRGEFNKIVLVCDGDQKDINRFDVPLEPGEQPEIKRIPPGEYTLQIRTAGNDKLPSLAFTVMHTRKNEAVRIEMFDYGRFRQELQRAKELNRPVGSDAAIPDSREFEHAWSVAYLKKTLPLFENAPEAFWNKFARVLNMACTPVNMQMRLQVIPPDMRPSIVIEHKGLHHE